MGKRFTIGFQTVNLHSKYSFALWNAIAREAETLGANLILFPGESPNTPYGFAYQSNAIYNFINPENLDALIMATGTLSPFMNIEDFEIYSQRFMPLPTVSIGIELKGCPSILVDNASGVKAEIRHLIQEHGLKRIAIIRGPESNAEAQSRFHAYIEELEANGIKPDPELFLPGNFMEIAGVEAVQELYLKKKVPVDAIIASNDDMALGALRELKNLNISVPHEIVVCGFDNIEAAQFSIPSLTTVSQPLSRQGKLALETAMALLEGKDVEKIYHLPTELIIRSSCGCVTGMRTEFSVASVDDHSSPSVLTTSDSPKTPMLLECEKILASFGYLSEEISFCTREIQALIELFETCRYAEKTSSLFLRRLVSFLQNALREKWDLKCWPEILRVMENHIREMRPDSTDIGIIKGCFQRANAMASEIIRTEYAYQKIEMENWNLKLREIQVRISSTRSPEDLSAILREELSQFQIKGCLVFRYKNSVIHSRGESWSTPLSKELVAGFLEDHTISRSETESTKLIPDFIQLPGEQMIWSVSSMFMMEAQLGYSMIRIGNRDGYLYESLNVLISGFINNHNLMNARDTSEAKLREALTKLESYSEKMYSISRTDELTGLYNRRGFLNLGAKSLSMALQMGKNGLVFFIDLDGLKRINDTFGHVEGDWAIKTTAEVLRAVFRGMDILARLGGDEFIVLTINTDASFCKIVETRVAEKMLQINRDSGKPYQLTMSIGWAVYRHLEPRSLEALMTDADNMLYEKKRAKKSIP